MKQRTSTYLGTFVNNVEGISSYKLMIKQIRQTVKGGRFVKMFRGNKRNRQMWVGGDGKIHHTNPGCSPKDGSTHFDVYLLNRSFHTVGTSKWSSPKFFNFELSR